jgi:IPT/TIG domain/FG-GAP-like repeat
VGRRPALVAFAAAALMVGGGSAAAAPVTFSNSFQYTFPHFDHSVRGIAVGDLNGDGRADIVAGEFGGKIFVFLNDGHGGFDAPQSYAGQCGNASAFGGLSGVAIGHFTSSGHMDVLVGCDWYTDGFVVYAGNGDGTLQAPRRIQPIEMYLGENTNREPTFGGIGLTNLVHGSFAGTTAVVWDEWQAGAFAPQLCMMPDSEIAADTGTDASPNAPHCSVTLTPDDTLDQVLEFPPPVVLGTLPFPTAGSAWAFGTTPADEGLNNAAFRGAVFLSDPPGYGWLDIEPQHAMASPPGLLAAPDLNGDGFSEIVAQAGTKIAVYDVASFVESAGVLVGPDPQLVSTNPALTQVYGAVAGDFDGDGHPDVAALGASNASNTYVEVLGGDGTTSLGAPQSFQVADFASDSYLASADFNGDGRPDLVTVVGDELKVLLDVVPSPAIASIAPSHGLVGTTVTVTGTHLDGATSVKLNGTAATFTAVSSSQLTFTVPAGATTGRVAVTTPGGTATSTQQFVVDGAAPVIYAVSPIQGRVGSTVTVLGRNFTGASGVRFNGTPAVSLLVVSPTTITAVVPVGATTGHVAVSGPGGTGVSLGTFTVLPALAPVPAIASFSPSLGIRGVRVTIRGSGLTGATQVTFNGAHAAFTVVNDSTITAVVPAAATTGRIMVTTPGGTATSAANFVIL